MSDWTELAELGSATVYEASGRQGLVDESFVQVVPGSLQVLVHQLPVRAQIDTILTEQLIVELYSKN